MQDAFLQYVESPSYHQDLLAVRRLWDEPKFLGIAGMFIFLSYITLPVLTAVQPVAGASRVSTMKVGLASEREKRFLQRMLGLSNEISWQGGISNIRVRKMISKLYRNHRHFLGMQLKYIDYFLGILSLSVLRVHAVYGNQADLNIKVCYWRYMRYTSSLFGVNLKEELATHQYCQAFIDERTQSSVHGKILLKALQQAYPQYVEKALPVLFPRTLLTVQDMMEDTNV